VVRIAAVIAGTENSATLWRKAFLPIAQSDSRIRPEGLFFPKTHHERGRDSGVAEGTSAIQFDSSISAALAERAARNSAARAARDIETECGPAAAMPLSGRTSSDGAVGFGRDHRSCTDCDSGAEGGGR